MRQVKRYMTIFFITGNNDKLREVQALIPDVQHIDLDLPEIQEVDPYRIIAAKLEGARTCRSGAFLVEDTSLALDGMGGLPGPLAKWFVKAIGARATARTIIGYADENGEVRFFEGSLRGRLVPPRGTHGFDWDAIFQPDGSEKTLAEMSQQEKNQCSMRRLAVASLQQYLKQEEKETI